jgi:phospholipid transport system substrate-binding protein
MSQLVRRIVLLAQLTAASAAVVSVASASLAASAAGPATVFVQGKYDSVVKLLKSAASPERDKKVDAELAGLIDFDEMAKTTLDKEWDKHSAAEQSEFRDLLRELIQKNYKERVNDTRTYAVDWQGETADGGDVVVHTVANNPSDKRAQPVKIDYVLRKKGAGWQAVDIVIEDASQVKTFRKEFKKKIDKDGWAALIQTMKDKRDGKKK